MSVLVRVVEPGIYMKQDLKANDWAEEGEVVEVHDGWYVDSLVVDGYVELHEEDYSKTVRLEEPKQPQKPGRRGVKLGSVNKASGDTEA